MRNIALATLAALTISTGFAQSNTRSIDVQLTPNRFSVSYLRDGFDDYVAVTAPVFTFSGTQNRLKAVTFGAADRWNMRDRLYVGTGLSFDLYTSENFSVSILGGWKGLNVADNFRMVDNNRAWVWGGSVSFKIN